MSKDNTCPTCKGEGWIFKSGGENDKRYDLLRFDTHHVTCPTCNGSGQQEDKYSRKFTGRDELGILKYDGTQEMLDEDMKTAGYSKSDTGYTKVTILKTGPEGQIFRDDTEELEYRLRGTFTHYGSETTPAMLAETAMEFFKDKYGELGK